MSSRRIPLFSAAAAAPLLLAGTLAFADGGIRVNYADLDLGTQKGLDALYGRIHTAARRYCEDLQSRTGSRITSGYRECVSDAVNTTVSSLNLPSLSALHADRGTRKNRS